jgi:hypothetical protein
MSHIQPILYLKGWKITIEPLKKNVEHDKYGCTAYTCDKPELLEQPGWEQFKKHAQREKKLVQMVNCNTQPIHIRDSGSQTGLSHDVT